MKALVLAAGIGERLKPITEITPKPLLEVGGHPLIHYPLAMLKRAGITDIAINVHYLAGKLQAALGDGSQRGLHVTWAPEPILLGTGGPLNGLKDFLRGDTFVIANSDTILDLDLAAVVAFHRERGALATIALCRPANLDYYSRLEIDAGARFRRMRLLKRRTPLEYDDYPTDLDAAVAASLVDHMYCGLIVVEPAVLDLIPPKPPWSLFNDLFAPMVAQGLPLFGWVHHKLMRTVDDLASYNQLRAEFANNPPTLGFAL
jgi:NDP-sugar pyrophosphorylase family protein